MPAEVAAASGVGTLPRTRPITRSSIRQSLTLANMGKALADVMHKESKESATEKERGGRKTRETTRRGSVAPPTASATALDKTVSSRREVPVSAETRTLTRPRRISTLQAQKSSGLTSSDDQSSSSPAGDSPKRHLTRASSLRPRQRVSGSALPKYRPKSVLVENVKTPPSPPSRVGTRRRLSSSDDEKEVGKQLLVPQGAEKRGRTISPLPHRGALKVNLTGAINVRPTTPEKKSRPSTVTSTTSPSKRQSSPSRLPTSRGKPSNSVKFPAGATPTASSTITRPASSASSNSSRTPRTPTPTTVQKSSKQPGGSTQLKSSQGPGSSPLRSSVPPQPDSPTVQASIRRRQRNASPTPSPSPARLMPLGGTRSLISTPGPIALSADSSIDSIDASDVEFMLLSVASSTAPTPSLPRVRTIRPEPNDNPHTPPRQNAFLPTRANMSYLSPLPPTSDGSPSLRPNRPRLQGIDRGSILSWEQLAQHNRMLGQEDVEHMLAEIDAPFRSVTASPAPSTLSDIPESPSLSALPSPTGYGSISQVLLPEVTPSPAIFNATLRFEQAAAESPIGESGAATMLKLQLAAAESAANEQRLRIEALESQLLSAKEARLRDTEELAHQVTVLEQQVQGSLRSDEQVQMQLAALEERLAHAQVAQEQAVCEALKRAQWDAVRAQQEALKVHYLRWSVSTLACNAGAAWGTVKTAAESDLDYIRSSRQMLSVLLAGLDHTLQQL
ncbi:hypothetical protein BDY19DRAFT_1052980 [Irpex rosettiformis]|uniref:Uncharacterized protein n=1 Tax=Irpex rosettiformis TaxID=378272 RepID=A0ACB8UPF5_9APHY|nr:hypothetical protein BDY19DRAFT_1052980 [Irpex rosettiformis]